MLSRIYIATSPRDTRLARICVASVRCFYPDLPIFLLPGGSLKRGFIEELRDHWHVQLAPIPVGDYGWGFVKLEPLFDPPGKPFLMLDADTVITGPVLDAINERLVAVDVPAFLVDKEEQSEADTLRLYYDWKRLREVDPEARCPAFVFNSGQWVGTPGVLSREDFVPWMSWTRPSQLHHADMFMPGDQGIFNYLLNQGSAAHRFRVERIPLMHWPGHGMEGFSVAGVRTGRTPARVVHWAGMKRLRLADTKGADLLIYFETMYYRRIPYGIFLVHFRALGYLLDSVWHRLCIWAKLFWIKKRIAMFK